MSYPNQLAATAMGAGPQQSSKNDEVWLTFLVKLSYNSFTTYSAVPTGVLK